MERQQKNKTLRREGGRRREEGRGKEEGTHILTQRCVRVGRRGREGVRQVCTMRGTERAAAGRIRKGGVVCV